ncbi:hypothetical protein GN330_00385 [Nitratireductor sp. CAU 1489]|uniref:Flagellar assembly protein FliH n=1 Tax=Nitratireductor arenosus TaxID=2682096 RepID=A0A844QC56_9HYPH|nr:hypothetical protein [Nitratireductor arenosus]MVA95708.1 hypothetical protein [Nitratireductor arenosus]
MANLSLADILVDFGKRDEPAPFETPMPDFDMPLGIEPMPPEPDLPDVDALIAEAVEKAVAEATARLDADHAAALEAERERHVAEVETLQAGLGEDLGAKIRESFDATEKRLLDLTAEVVTRVLGPVLAEDLQRRSVSRLAEIIRTSVRDAETTKIRVHGPMSLYQALEDALGEQARLLEFTESNGLDLSVVLDGSVYETRLSEWSVSAAEVLA